MPIVDYLTNENIRELTQLIQSAFISASNVCISELIATSSTASKLNETISSTNGYDAIIETNLIQTCVSVPPLHSPFFHPLSIFRLIYTIIFINQFKLQLNS